MITYPALPISTFVIDSDGSIYLVDEGSKEYVLCGSEVVPVVRIKKADKQFNN